MSAWQNTYAQLGAEIQAAKTAAVQAFMAAEPDSTIGSPPAAFPAKSRQETVKSAPLSPDDVAKLKIVVWRALAQAILTHIGPVSSDGSVTFGIVNDRNKVPQLDIRAAQAWMHTKLHPVIANLPGPREAMLWQEDPITGLPVGLWLKDGDADGQWSLVWPDIDDAPLTPTQIASRLYPAEVADSYKLPDVDAIYGGYSACANYLFGSQFVEGPPGTWTRTTNGLLPEAWVDGQTAFVGMRLLAWAEGLYASELKYALVYVVVDPGQALERPAVLKYTGEKLVQNTHVHVLTGTVHTGQDWYVTSPDPQLPGTSSYTWAQWTAAWPTIWTVRYNLLTGPQLTSEGASKDTLTMYATASAGDAIFPNSFETLIGTPGLDSIPAGIWKSDIEGIWIDSDTPPSSGSVTTLRWNVLNASTAALLFTMESPPISNTILAALSFQYLDTGHAISPTDQIEVVPIVHTTSTTPVTLWMVYNSAGRGTRFTVPFALPITGAATGRHPDLSLRNAPLQHPLSSTYSAIANITGGTGIQLPLALTSPDPTSPDRANFIRFTCTGDNTLGLISTSWTDGTPVPDAFRIQVFVENATPSEQKRVVDGATPTSGYAALALPATHGVVGPLTLSGPTMLWLWLDIPASRWRLDHAVTYAVAES